MTLTELSIVEKRIAKTKAAQCAQHGDYIDSGLLLGKRVIWMGCPVCAVEDLDRENARLASEAAKHNSFIKASRVIGDAAIPARYRDRTLDGYRVTSEGQQNALDTSMDYLQELINEGFRGSSLLFYGSSGTGKTHLAIGIAHELIGHGGSALYTRAARIAQRIKETYGRKSERTEREVYESFSAPDLLIIDEVGRQFGTDAEKLMLFEVINSRYETMKPTVVISNLSGEALIDYLGEAAMDRLREGGQSVLFDWASFRRRGY